MKPVFVVGNTSNRDMGQILFLSLSLSLCVCVCQWWCKGEDVRVACVRGK